jgi:hypothetical protein
MCGESDIPYVALGNRSYRVLGNLPTIILATSQTNPQLPNSLVPFEALALAEPHATFAAETQAYRIRSGH